MHWCSGVQLQTELPTQFKQGTENTIVPWSMVITGTAPGTPRDFFGGAAWLVLLHPSMGPPVHAWGSGGRQGGR